MQDYTSYGIPVSKLSTNFLEECLRDGVKILDNDGLSDEEAVKRVIKRIEIELECRNTCR